MESSQFMKTEESDKKPLHRIASEFYRVMLVSPKDTQTIALVPDQTFASDITRLLTEHIKIHADQHFICKRDKLRPTTEDAMKKTDWSTRVRGNGT